MGTERHNREPHLRTETRDLLTLARQLTGQAVSVKRAPRFSAGIRGMLTRPQYPGQAWQVLYLREHESVLDHIIAHEVGHLHRLYSTPAHHRLAAITTHDQRTSAVAQLMPELTSFLARGAPPDQIVALTDGWIDEVCTMLANFPRRSTARRCR